MRAQLNQPNILVIGGPSLDTITINGRTHKSPGRAGLYTALAAVHCGGRVTQGNGSII